MTRWLDLPEDFRPTYGWLYGGLQGNADVRMYTRQRFPDVRWCDFLRVAPGDAAVYPAKLQIPNMGEGQFKWAEVTKWRYLADVLDALVELDRTHGIRPEFINREGSALPPSIDPKWAWEATSRLHVHSRVFDQGYAA